MKKKIILLLVPLLLCQYVLLASSRSGKGKASLKRKVLIQTESELQRKLVGKEGNDRFVWLNAALEKPHSYWVKSEIYLEIARMYNDIEDAGEALHYAEQARLADPGNQRALRMMRRLHPIVHPKPKLGQRLRSFNGERGLFLNVASGFEYASNVVQESVRPDNATNKEGTAWVLNASYSKSWKKQIRDFSQETLYSFSNYTYGDHSELNLLNQSVLHQFLLNRSKGKDDLTVIVKTGLGHIFSDSSSLLWNGQVGSSLYYLKDRHKILWDGDLTYTFSNYFSQSNDGEEGDSITLTGGGTKFLSKDNLRTLRLGLNLTYESPEAASSRYQEATLSITYEQGYENKWLTSWSPYFETGMRFYEGAEVGEDRREDQQHKIGVLVSIPTFKFHNLSIDISYLENESNITRRHYRKNQVSMMYDVSF